MKLYNEIKQLRNKARINSKYDSEGFNATKILSVVLGEADRLLDKSGQIEDQKLIKVIEKIISNNNEVLKHRDVSELVFENNILKSLIPPKITDEEIRRYINDNLKQELTNAKSVGQAVGIVMKNIKGMNVDNKQVFAIVDDMYRTYRLEFLTQEAQEMGFYD